MRYPNARGNLHPSMEFRVFPLMRFSALLAATGDVCEEFEAYYVPTKEAVFVFTVFEW